MKHKPNTTYMGNIVPSEVTGGFVVEITRSLKIYNMALGL